MLKIAMAQMEVIPGHPDKNAATMLRMIDEAKENQADVVIFPEMAIPGYLLGDTWEQTSFLADCELYGQEIIEASKGITVMFGNIAMDWEKMNNDGRVRKYNAFFTAQDGKLIAPAGQDYPFVIKTLMPNYREFDDTRHFYSLQQLALEQGKNPADLIAPVTLTLQGKSYNAGCLLCEDGWSDNYALEPLQILQRFSHRVKPKKGGRR